MKSFEAFLPHVMPKVPGCPEPTVIHCLRQAVIEFCQRTKLWRCDDEFDVTPASCDVICAPAGSQILDIEHATFEGFPLDPISIADLDAEYPRWRTDTDTTMPQYFTQIDFDTVRVVPAGTGKLKLYTILMPAEDGEDVPDWMHAKYARVIAAGALKDLLITPGQPFYNAELASGYASRFYDAMDTNASKRMRGQQRAPIRTRPQYL